MLASPQRVRFEQPHLRIRLGREAMEGDGHIVTERSRAAPHGLHPRVEHIRDVQGSGRAGNKPAMYIALVDAGDVHGCARARQRALYLVAMRLQSTYASPETAGHDLDLHAGVQVAIDQRARDDAAEAVDREYAIDRQARPANVALGWQAGDGGVQRLTQRIEPNAADRRARDDRRCFERRSRQHLADIALDKREPVVIDEIALRERDDAVPHVEQIEDGEVLSRLRHHTVVGGDDEQRDIDTAGAGEHVLDEALVSRNVDDADASAARQRQPCEPQIDRHAARFFFAQPIRVDPRQRLDEQRFTVVDVPRCADDVHAVR